MSQAISASALIEVGIATHEAWETPVHTRRHFASRQLRASAPHHVRCGGLIATETSLGASLPILLQGAHLRELDNHERARRRPAGRLDGAGPGDRTATPESANNLLKVLRLLLAYAVDPGMIPHNPGIGVKSTRARARASTHGPKTRLRSSRPEQN